MRPQATSGHSCPIRLAVRHLANDPSLDDVSPDLRQAPRNVKCPLEEDDCVLGGRDGVLMLLAAGGPGRLHIVVVAPGCGPDGGELLGSRTLGG